ncbi:MAG: trypsin-like peptidase domain-containing protein [Zoogloeaceae bacterium]|jgi:Do/DeqQ family serine protease|nr:trypsin-like peptidase domain-containing protein [Zoogloeaceae bacterium]
MRKLWLIFAQTTTVALALLFVVMTLKPEWLAYSSPSPTVVTLQERARGDAVDGASAAYGFREAARRALPAVVHIFTSQKVRTQRHPLMDDPVFRRFFGEGFEDAPRQESGLGSGVIVSPDGYILTNFHVIDAADQIEIALADGRKLKAKVVGSDPESDLAVIQVEADNLPAITFGHMSNVGVGDMVLAIGNPFGVGQTVTMGIVSALGRTHLGINTFENFIQTDAAINPGNSGGALVDAEGMLVGINTAIYSRTGGSLGIGFAIPVSSARLIMEQIIQNGAVIRGWIGVEAQEITPELAESFGLSDVSGALIAGVVRGSPADQARIQPGDVLLAVGAGNIRDPQEMLDAIAALKPGEETTFRLRRARNIIEVTVKIGQRPPLQFQKKGRK